MKNYNHLGGLGLKSQSTANLTKLTIKNAINDSQEHIDINPIKITVP